MEQGFFATNRKKIFVVFYLLYFFFLLSLFSPLSRCLTEVPLSYDYALHYVDSLVGHRFFDLSHHIWGYNPFYYAGYVSGVYLAIDNHVALLFQILLGHFLNPVLVFNLSFFLCYLSFPILAFFGAKNFKQNDRSAFMFSVFSGLFFMTTSPFFPFLTVGVYGFLSSIFLSFFVVSLLYRYITLVPDDPSRRKLWIFLTLSGSIAFFVHPLSSIICAILAGPLVIFFYKKFLKEFFPIILFLSIVLLCNLFWVLPYVHFLSTSAGWGYYLQTEARHVLELLVPYLGFLLFVAVGLRFRLKYVGSDQKKILYAILFSTGIFFILAFFGSSLGFSFTEPRRFDVCFFTLLLFLSASFFENLQWKKSLIVFGVCLLSLLFLLSPRPSLECGITENVEKKLFASIKEHVPFGARLEVEQNSLFPTFGGHHLGFLQEVTQVQSVAGNFPMPPENVRYTQFVDGVLFGKKLSVLTEQELEANIELYNVPYFLVFSDQGKTYFDTTKKFETLFSEGSVVLYRYKKGESGFCYRCHASVVASLNKLSVTKASDRVTILKYHYFDFLRVTPSSLALRPVYLLDDPVPFIGIDNGEISEFTIYTKY